MAAAEPDEYAGHDLESVTATDSGEKSLDHLTYSSCFSCLDHGHSRLSYLLILVQSPSVAECRPF